MKNTLIIILSIFLLASCVNQRVPNKEKRAKKKLAKHLSGMQKILNVYPNLSDTLTTIVQDTIVIKTHTVDTVFETSIDTIEIETLLDEYVSVQDSIYQIRSNSLRLSDRNKREINRLRKREKSLRDRLIKASTPDTTFTFEDSIITTKITIVDGTYSLSYIVKQKRIPFTATVTNNIDMDCDTYKPFWEQWKFWLFILMLILIAYFLRR